jgi:MFS family permease
MGRDRVDETSKTSYLNEKYSIKNGIAATFVLNLTNNYFALFAISVLGATNYQVGLISSMPPFMGMFGALLGAVVLGKLEEKKKVTMGAVFFTRIFLLLMCFVVYVPEDLQIWAFLFAVGVMNLPGSFTNLSWQALIGDLIPEHRRNDFFSERNRIVTIVGMLTTLVAGIALQTVSKSWAFPYQILFFLAFLFGLFEIYYLGKHVEPHHVGKKKKKFNLGLSAFKHKPYLYFVICALFFNFAWQIAWPLFNIFQIKDAHANGLWVSLFVVANQLAQIISFKWWGKMSDKHGTLTMLFIASIGMAISPVITILSTNLLYLTLTNLVSGLAVSGTVLLLFNQLLNVAPKEERSACIANYNILLAIIGFIAPELGVFLLDITNMTIAMLISFVLRLLGAAIFFILLRFTVVSNRKPKAHII